MRAIVRRDCHRAARSAQQLVENFGECIRARNVLSHDRSGFTGTKQHALLWEPDRLCVPEAFVQRSDRASGRQWRGGDTSFDEFEAQGVINEEQHFVVFDNESKAGVEATF